MGFNLPNLNDPKKKTGGFATALKQAIKQPQNVAPAWTRPPAPPTQQQKQQPAAPGPTGQVQRPADMPRQLFRQFPDQPVKANSWYSDMPASVVNNPNWRNDNAAALMTPQEYLMRRDFRARYGSGGIKGDWYKNAPAFKSYLDMAAKTPEQSHAINSPWFSANPRPRFWWEPTIMEEYNRNAAAPTGYAWSPFGTGYVSLPTVPSLGQAADANGNSGGGGYSGGWGWSSGGGYSQSMRDWYQNLLNWNINRPDKGG